MRLVDASCEPLIIGAGPTGMCAARQLEYLSSFDWRLIEANQEAGGLAASFVDQEGFTWDVGGHVQFSHYDYVDIAMDDFLGKDGWISHERESWVWLRNRFVPYLFQDNLHRLPVDELERCLAVLVDVSRHGKVEKSDLNAWILSTFAHLVLASRISSCCHITLGCGRIPPK